MALPGREPVEILDALSQHEPVQVGGIVNYLGKIISPRPRYLVIQPVCERSAEHAEAFTGFFSLAIPTRRSHPSAFSCPFALGVWSPLHLVKSVVPLALCITVVAAGRHVLASHPGIECVVSPSNLAVLHNLILSK